MGLTNKVGFSTLIRPLGFKKNPSSSPLSLAGIVKVRLTPHHEVLPYFASLDVLGIQVQIILRALGHTNLSKQNWILTIRSEHELTKQTIGFLHKGSILTSNRERTMKTKHGSSKTLKRAINHYPFPHSAELAGLELVPRWSLKSQHEELPFEINNLFIDLLRGLRSDLLQLLISLRHSDQHFAGGRRQLILDRDAASNSESIEGGA